MNQSPRRDSLQPEDPPPPLPVLVGKVQSAFWKNIFTTDKTERSVTRMESRERFGLKSGWSAFGLTVFLALFYIVVDRAHWYSWNYFFAWIQGATSLTVFVLTLVALINIQHAGWRERLPLNCALTALGICMAISLVCLVVGWSQQWNASVLVGVIWVTLTILAVSLVAFCTGILFRTRRSLLAVLIILITGSIALYLLGIATSLLAFT